ncbi:MAG: exodeoxyribonuclease VII small subunit [Paludibacteraceae bacterium]|jgi:exodeoxyribonuclease VII small subunit|nr:exodeoxyribonuclease VII small subunit [Paludibacteraceae bacterium]HOI25947.1 exodeoxyribonuclease VII small subunit [Paludibacteraceae bacterium]HOU67824.1 exodeoxyribonuclease VII small subunit [Paludibacteraceae bacterium]HQF49774.1 exodeoxyribonuclease VII small subunit [Paludibacteraceae bacterium]HQJ89902.1 exodeoxyribonuclease VII small subunit [Paludibacteraceae bacterium]
MAKKESTYKDSILELESIIKDLEENQLEIDDLAAKAKRATELIKFCKEKLYGTESEVNKILEDLDKE